MTHPVRPVGINTIQATFTEQADGSLIVASPEMLGPWPAPLSQCVRNWALIAPDRVCFARRGADRAWVQVTYAEAWRKIQALAGAIVARGLSAERPIAILSGNSIEHALLALAAMHVGVPYTPVSVAYSLVSSDFSKLRHIFDVTTPGLVFAEDGHAFAAAIAATVAPNVELVFNANPPNDLRTTNFDDLVHSSTEGVDAAAARVGNDTIAKFLFTSGSTGLPKGVINTQRMLCSNQAMLNAVFPDFATTPPVLVDWLPWNHTFGGNHNFGLVLTHGGTLYIDDGKPIPGKPMQESIANLREIAPTVYFNVPKGFEELVGYLEREPDLRRTFFSRVNLMFYAGAGLAQHVWDTLDRLAIETTGHKVTMMTGLGSTETAPFALSCVPDCVRAGVVGLPVAGTELKLVPNGDKWEARIKGPNITPGYWRNPAQTAAAFDADGWYSFGDALRWVDPARKDWGFAFDGRISEDFKLGTGTWVSVGPLRAGLLDALAPYIRDVVVAGIDRDYLAVILIPDVQACAAVPDLNDRIRVALQSHAAKSRGSSTRVVRAVMLHGPLSIDIGEITDKGSINQRAVLKARANLVAALYANPKTPDIISIED